MYHTRKIFPHLKHAKSRLGATNYQGQSSNTTFPGWDITGHSSFHQYVPPSIQAEPRTSLKSQMSSGIVKLTLFHDIDSTHNSISQKGYSLQSNIRVFRFKYARMKIALYEYYITIPVCLKDQGFQYLLGNRIYKRKALTTKPVMIQLDTIHQIIHQGMVRVQISQT